MKAKEFLATKEIGAILRIYNNNPEFISSSAEKLKEFVEQLLGIKIFECHFISLVLIQVWNDQRFRDENGEPVADCNQTASYIKEHLIPKYDDRVVVNDFKRGGLYVDILNDGIGILAGQGIQYALVASTEARGYLNQPTAQAMVEAICRGALATGVAIKEIERSVLCGRLANTLAIWNIQAATRAGLFPAFAEKPMNAYFANWRHSDGGSYLLQGVEEIGLLARLITHNGPCVAPSPADIRTRSGTGI